MIEKLRAITCVVSHQPDEDLRFRLKDAEACFGQFTNSEAKSTNLPDSAPPDAPRIVLQGKRRQIVLSQDRTQAKLSFQDSDKSSEEAQAIAYDAIDGVFDLVKKFHPGLAFTDFGVVAELDYPVRAIDDKQIIDKVSKAVTELIYSGPTFGQPANLEIKIGFKTPWGGYRNIALNVYEMREGTVGAKGARQMDLTNLRLKAIGLAVMLDVNDKGLEDLSLNERERFTRVTADSRAYVRDFQLRKELLAIDL